RGFLEGRDLARLGDALLEELRPLAGDEGDDLLERQLVVVRRRALARCVPRVAKLRLEWHECSLSLEVEGQQDAFDRRAEEVGIAPIPRAPEEPDVGRPRGVPLAAEAFLRELRHR